MSVLPIAPIRKNLRFQCLGPECNRCCSGGEFGAVVHLTPEDVVALGDDIGRVQTRWFHGELLMTLEAGRLCSLWEEGVGCSVYGRAPRQCRTYPWWRYVMEDEERYEAEKRRCPGIGEGPRVPLRDVKRALAQDRHSSLFRPRC